MSVENQETRQGLLVSAVMGQLPSAIEPVGVAPAAVVAAPAAVVAAPAAVVAVPVNAVAVETNRATALECLRQADAEFEEAQRRRKAALEELFRVQEAEVAETQERFFAKYGLQSLSGDQRISMNGVPGKCLRL
jgi:hypothetical protein